MDYEKFLTQLNNGDVRSYFLFETFILKLIQHDMQSATLSVPYRAPLPFAPFRFDAVIREGFGNLPGPTAVEVKLSKLGRRAFPALLDTFVRVYDTASSVGLKSFLFICGGIKLAPTQKKDLESLGGEPSGVSVLVWDDDDIQKLINKHQSYSEELVSNLAIISLSAFPHKSSDITISSKFTLQIGRLRQAYEDSELTLVLGAGVSRGAGMADWNALLDALFVSVINQKLAADSIEIDQPNLDFLSKQYRKIEDGNGPLLFARYIRKGLEQSMISQPEAFLRAVTDTLYNSRDMERRDTSELLQELAKICVPRRGGASIRAIITYNFDDLLERHLEDKSIEYRSIYCEGESPSRHELPIYHVHGFLPRNPAKYVGIEKSLLVFSEEGYHKLFSDQYHWSNLIQLHHMIESTCLMTGLSLTDPNIRRLLEISARHHEMPRHYALLQRMSFEKFIKKADPAINYTKESVEKFLIMHHNIQEDLLKELGVNIIWFDEFSDMPGMIQQIASPQKPTTRSRFA